MPFKDRYLMVNIVNHDKLFLKLRDLVIPILLCVEEWKCLGKTGVFPSSGKPSGKVNHSKRAQGFNRAKTLSIE